MFPDPPEARGFFYNGASVRDVVIGCQRALSFELLVNKVAVLPVSRGRERGCSCLVFLLHRFH